jgi:hypothetical protein
MLWMPKCGTCGFARWVPKGPLNAAQMTASARRSRSTDAVRISAPQDEASLQTSTLFREGRAYLLSTNHWLWKSEIPIAAFGPAKSDPYCSMASNGCGKMPKAMIPIQRKAIRNLLRAGTAIAGAPSGTGCQYMARTTLR